MFTRTQLETIEALLTEALGNRKRAEKEISKKEQTVFLQLQEVLSRGGSFRKYTPPTESANEYIDGTYRLWKRPSGGIGIKLDKQNELYNIPKDTDLYTRVNNLFTVMEAEHEQEGAELSE